MQAYPGTSFTLTTSAGAAMNPVTGFIVPIPRQFEVTGVFETGMYEYDNKYVFVDLEQARMLAGLGSAVTGIELRTPSRDSARVVARQLTDTLGYPYHTIDWGEQNSALFRALKLEKFGMAVILALIVVVAAFNIVSTLTMVVRDKTREIGILKAMGLRAASVRRVFVAQGLVIGVVGTALGLALGVAAGVALDRYHLISLDPQVYFIDHLPVRMDPADVGLIVLLSVGVATLATLFPASQAARLFPVDAIRSE
jgi:lipoprotein-releasing system permease protein